MQKHKIQGGTGDYAEIIVDYKNDKTDIKGVGEETTTNKLKSAAHDWIIFLYPYLAVSLLILIILKIPIGWWFFISWACIIGFLSLLHLNNKWHKKFKTYFAIRSGKGKRNKAKISELKSKEFVIYNMKNRVVEFDTTGDVRKQLSKIWIKEEHPSSSLSNQARCGEMMFLDDNPIWNVYFIFENIPKDGELYVEWI